MTGTAAPTRRRLLGLAAAGLAAATLPRPALAKPPTVMRGPTPITVNAWPLKGFSINQRPRRDFGALDFLGGVELHAREEGFGGISGLRLTRDGSRLLAVTDAGQWLSAGIVHGEGGIAGLSDAILAPLLGADGRPLRRTRHHDAESLTGAEGVVHVGIERRNAVMRFDLARGGLEARGVAVELPAQARALPFNRGLEALATAPATHPLAGALIGISERSSDADETTMGFVLTGSARGSFTLMRSGGYDVSDMDFLPDGDALVLERRFSLLRGIGMRIRRIAARDLKPGAQAIDGPVLIEADSGHEIDNMEGLAVHRGPDGRAILTLVSDDNFSLVQRTLLMQFALRG